MYLSKKLVLFLFIFCISLISQTFAQEKNKKVNFDYSTNPPAKVSKKINKKNKQVGNNSSNNPKINKGKIKTATNVKNTSIASKTREVARKARLANLPPTEIYKVGVGDVLYINLQNTRAKYYTVLVDGTIDYPLAGKLVSVIDLTTEEIEDLLRENIKLYENPQITVRVREYASHKIIVKGLARVGEHFLQREAMPLLVVKNMVGVKPTAKRVIVERENSEPKIINFGDNDADNFLIYKNDKLIFEGLEVTSSISSKTKFYFVGNKICSGGKKEFHKGITLVQAIFDVCGGMNNKLKKVKIIRKTKSGVFITKIYNYKKILQGKENDPLLQVGDMLDVEK